ncbi:hypothetical protein GCM10023320_42950 [Pseudonocardia adelaidensis]|uniref:Uncharacterized protein n=2 Tax=Pseudonocardia adelaidensis TaxID=648754 RepID=A0ABP9NM06_9PSEU
MNAAHALRSHFYGGSYAQLMAEVLNVSTATPTRETGLRLDTISHPIEDVVMIFGGRCPASSSPTPPAPA